MKMSEITVENIETVAGPGAPQTFAERLVERGDGDFVEPAEVPEPPVLERQTAVSEAAPKKRADRKQRRSRKQKRRSEAARPSKRLQSPHSHQPLSTLTKSWNR